ncbi:MAG: FAD-binding protein [Gemmatimonadaceae bacterium]|nr:FAD-binding protein [Gemmatimonadaceae bacterium]
MQSPENAAALADIVRHAAAHDTPLRLAGSGTWQHAGGPFVSDSPVSLAALRGVIAYEPGDLVITVGAGTTLSDLDAATRPHGQMLAVHPYGSPHGTIGACVATASPAPLALGDLATRDLVLGLDVVTGTGEVTRVGGRVVKNVAGFDLVRLHIGAWGTLGAITEVTLRLHAIPQVDAIMVGTLEQDIAHALPALVANRAPLPMIVRLRPNRPAEVWARVSGNTQRAAALTDRLAALGVTALSHVANADALRETPSNAVVLRARTAVSDAAPFVLAAQRAFPDAELLYDPAKGSLRIVHSLAQLDGTGAPLDARIAQLMTTAATNGAQHAVSVVVDQGRTTPHTRNAIEQGLKRAMDPRDVMNRYEGVHASEPQHA